LRLKNKDSVLAVIPAKKISKRLPSKNLKLFNGFPLIYYSIKFALISGIKNIVVSSDCSKIISYSKKLGVATIERPSELATDSTPTISVLKHALEIYSDKGFQINLVVTLQPTTPLRKKSLFSECYLKFKNNNYDSLISIGTHEKKLGILDQNQCYKPLNYSIGSRSQDLNKTYYENGLIYFSLARNIFNNDLLGNKIGTLVVDGIASNIDIDYMEDFTLGEFFFNEYYDDYKYLID